MKIIEETKSIQNPDLPLLSQYFSHCSLGIFDLETLGLNKRRDPIILGGLVFPRKNHLVIKQYFAQSLEEEKDILSRIAQDLHRCDVIITYNGRSFDLPFLEERCGLWGIPTGFHHYHWDLYALVRHFSPLAKMLPNLKQKTLENFMGLWTSRYDEISGKESVSLYKDYLTHGREEDLKKILRHNYDDILQLYQLLSVSKKTDYHRGFSHWGFPVKVDEELFIVETIKIESTCIQVRGTHHPHPLEYIHFGEKEISGEFTGHRFSFSIPTIQAETLRLIDGKINGMEKSATSQGYFIIAKGEDYQYYKINQCIAQYIERIGKKWIIKN